MLLHKVVFYNIATNLFSQKVNFKPLTGNGYSTFHNLCIELDTEAQPISWVQNNTDKLGGEVSAQNNYWLRFPQCTNTSIA